MNFAVCCVTRFSKDQLNRFLLTDYEEGKKVTDLDDPRLVIVDDLEKTYESPSLSLVDIKGFPFKDMSVSEIFPILREAIESTSSSLNSQLLVVLDEESVANSTALLAVGYRRPPSIEVVRVEFGNCNVEMVNLWVGGTSVEELQEIAAKSPDGVLRWSK